MTNDNESGTALSAPLLLPNGSVSPNRLVKAATSELLADTYNRATRAHETLYDTWARGGPGLLLTGNVQISYRHLEHPGNVVIRGKQDAEHLARLRAWSAAAKGHGAQVWMQLSHAGRQTNRWVNPTPFAPSAVPLNIPGVKFGTPVALNDVQILELIARFAEAAVVARETGFDGAQLHAAHGYLISQFLSPRANLRDDDWGGDLSRRSRFLLETVRAVRGAVGTDFAVAVKLNSADFQRGGFTFGECQTLGAWLDEAGADLIEISGGTYEQPKATGVEGAEPVFDPHVGNALGKREAYFAKFAPDLRRQLTRTKLMVTGGFRTPQGMADAVVYGDIDLIGLARALCVNPAAPRALLRGEPVPLDGLGGKLKVGPGLLSPHSPISLARTLNNYGAGAWYSQQVARMGAGLSPDPGIAFLPTLVRTLRGEKQKAALLSHARPAYKNLS